MLFLGWGVLHGRVAPPSSWVIQEMFSKATVLVVLCVVLVVVVKLVPVQWYVVVLRLVVVVVGKVCRTTARHERTKSITNRGILNVGSLLQLDMM